MSSVLLELADLLLNLLLKSSEVCLQGYLSLRGLVLLDQVGDLELIDLRQEALQLIVGVFEDVGVLVLILIQIQTKID